MAFDRDGYTESGSNGSFLTVSQVAQMLHAHPHSVRRWADLDLLPSYRFGIRGDRRFKPEEVSDFMGSNKED